MNINKKSNSTWLYGKHAVKQALENQARTLYQLIATEKSIEKIKGSYEHISNLKVSIVKNDVINSILGSETVHQSLALETSPIKELDLEDVIINTQNNSCIIILDQITDPHNIGAILRSAAAFNVNAVITTERNSPHDTATIAKSASGALEITPLIKVTNLVNTIKQLKKSDYWIIGLDGNTKDNLSTIDLKGKIALILGSESTGLRRLTAESCDFIAKIPINSKMESLNVSNACAIALYEYTRQNNVYIA